jgi:hypothetical protein
VCGPEGFSFGPEFQSRVSGENDECDWVDWLGIKPCSSNLDFLPMGCCRDPERTAIFTGLTHVSGHS